MSNQASPLIPDNEEEYKKTMMNRQVYAIGADAMRKYQACDVLVVGLTGLGLEIVKNIVLSGVRAVTIIDDNPIAWSDLSSLFYAAPEDVGKPRAATLLPKICELNRFCRVTVAPAGSVDASTGLVNDDILKAHHIAVFVDHRTTLLTRQNERCRAIGVKMIGCESRGVACSVFVDGGAGDFTVLDKNGEDTVLCVVADIESDGTIHMSDDKKHELENGDLVYFLGLPGVHGKMLNSHPPTHAHQSGGHAPQADSTNQMKMFKVKSVLSPYVVQIETPPEWDPKVVPKLVIGGGEESVGGFLQTTKQPVVMNFKPLSEAVVNPNFFGVIDDDPKMFCEGSLHNIFRAIHKVCDQVRSDNVTNAMDDVLREGKAVDTDIDVDLLKVIASAFHGNLCPISAFIGAITAQEVLKLASGKYRPIDQWLYFDVRELVQLRPAAQSAAEFAPRNSRYDGQIAVLGNTVHQRMLDSSCFIVGAGALGCEHVKNVAMTGIGCGQGAVTITDMDYIELSNLSRQFLFRQHHVENRRSKSSAAAEAAHDMNKSLNILPKELRVGSETETIFNEHFWKAQTVILNALDNVPARLYVDEQCVMHQRPLFESGTTGPKLNTQSVIPFVTENYGASRDPPEKEFALCTLKNFPNSIEHTIHWAKEAFGTEFTAIPTEVNNYIHSHAAWRNAVQRDPSSKQGAFKQIAQSLATVPKNWDDCVAWARVKFEDYFVNEIKQLMYNLPLGSERDGKPVWGGAKRPPKHAVFDASNQMHEDFILAAASLRAVLYNVERPEMTPENIERLRRHASTVSVPEWQPRRENVQVNENEKQQDGSAPAPVAAAAASSSAGDEMVGEDKLPPAAQFQHVKLNIQEFEKDDDTNFHVDFMTAVSNLRASNYGIPVATRDHTKFVAGKIIPAMITTTAAACGLVGIEVLKYMVGARKLEHYRSSFINIAVPLWNMSAPMAAAKAKSYKTSTGKEISFTLWDRIDIGTHADGRELTLQEVIDHLKREYDLEVDMISTSTAKIVYMGMMTKADKLRQTITQLLAGMECPVKPEDETVALIVTATCNDEDVDVPAVQFRFRGQM